MAAMMSACVKDLKDRIPIPEIWVKRMAMTMTMLIAYADICLDGVNAYTLFQEDHVAYGLVLVTLMLLPNVMTWAFLHANGSAQWSELPVAILQLAPLVELGKSWGKGEESPGQIWYMAAEGLGEAPLAGLLTAYILAFGGQKSMTFYLSLGWQLHLRGLADTSSRAKVPRRSPLFLWRHNAVHHANELSRLLREDADTICTLPHC
jgi:hypothetical protein